MSLPDGGDAGTSDASTDAGPPNPAPPAPLDQVAQTARYTIPELGEQAYIVRTEMDVPHVYAKDRLDAMRVFGFAMAKDRFFQMDLTSRLSEGRLSELLGDAALSSDIENRMIGATYMTDVYLAGLSDEEGAELDAFAEGVNAYIAAVASGAAPPPAELALAAIFFGVHSPVDLMEPWDRRDVAATGATVLYGTSFETGDQGRSAALAGVDTLFAGYPNEDLRRAGLAKEIMSQYATPRDSTSAAGWGLDTAGSTPSAIVGPRPGRTLHTGATLPEHGVLERLGRRLDEVKSRFPRDPDEGYGSNEWAVMGSATTTGESLLCGDGHLQLSSPALFWQMGIDTVLMGGAEGEDTRLLGATIAGLPLMGVGTNGHVAWTQTAYFADVTDWYTEELVLGSDGVPESSMFGGTAHPLTRVDEAIVIADREVLGSVGRTEMIPRFTTFDGRWITSIEGRTVTEDEPLGPGEARINVMGDLIVPGDVDGDGKVSAVSFYYGPFDGGTLLRAFREFSMADTVEDFRQAMRHFIGYGGSMAAADSEGSVLYSAYHAVPCRDYLPRDSSNVWIDGADPRRLIDGTEYGAWHIPLDADGRVDEAAAASGGPTACAVPFDQWPQALNPARQYIHNANNDPGNITTDNDLFDDPYYIGGPWIEGYRAARIEQRLQEAIAAHTADVDEMADIQADHHSNLGEEWAAILLESIEAARTAAAGTPASGSPEERMAARWTAAQADYVEVERRIHDWMDAGFPTPSGVETFYSPVVAGDHENAIATSIFHSWFATYVKDVLDDEHIPGDLSPAVTGDTFRTQTITLLVHGRGATNPLDLGSFDPTTNESAFFDDVTTPEVESSQEIGLRALDEALAFLRSDPTEPGKGGFGSDDFDDWVWGLRHMVRFDSLLADFIGDDPSLGFLVDMFSITPERIPLADDIAMTDPRFGLPHFPRPANHLDIDAANPGLDTNDWSHGSGPVFRMVVALGPDGVHGQNIIPGGQSGLPSSPHFDDQVRLWLANETLPMRYLPDEVVAGASGLERFAPR